MVLLTSASCLLCMGLRDGWWTGASHLVVGMELMGTQLIPQTAQHELGGG